MAASPILAAAQTYAVQRSMSALLPKADMCSARGHCPLRANSGHSRTRSPCLIKNLVQCSDVPREKSLFGWEHRCTAPALCVQARGSALPPKADMCSATSDVCYGPIADIATFTRSPCVVDSDYSCYRDQWTPLPHCCGWNKLLQQLIFYLGFGFGALRPNKEYRQPQTRLGPFD